MWKRSEVRFLSPSPNVNNEAFRVDFQIGMLRTVHSAISISKKVLTVFIVIISNHDKVVGQAGHCLWNRKIFHSFLSHFKSAILDFLTRKGTSGQRELTQIHSKNKYCRRLFLLKETKKSRTKCSADGMICNI